MYTGPYRSKKRRVEIECDLSTLSTGQLVAVHCENCDKEPLLGKVRDISGDDIHIVWLDGEYSKQWKISKQRDPTNRKKLIDWTDTIPRSSIILFDFELTAAKHLRKTTIQHLRKVYEQLKSGS